MVSNVSVQPSMSNASGKKSSQTRRAFDCEFKLRAVKDYYQDGKNIARTARKFEIDHKQVRLWVQKEKKIMQQKSRSKADGQGCSARYPLVEDRLYKEFLDLDKEREFLRLKEMVGIQGSLVFKNPHSTSSTRKILVADVHAAQQTDAVKTALRNYKTELVMFR